MKHHYVPQFLLSGWSAGSPDGKLQVFRLDLPGTPTRRLAPRSTGYETDLVALSKDAIAGMGKHAVETKFLSLIDNEAARVRTKLIEQGLRSLTSDERSHWTRFIQTLRVRQPDMVQEIKLEGARQLRESLEDEPEDYVAPAGDPDPLSLVEWAKAEFPGLVENFGLSIFPDIATSRAVAEQIFRLKWWLWKFDDSRHELLLGDNPCIFTGGLDAPELVVALPIAPRYAFVATRGERTAERLRKTSPTILAALLNESSVSQARVRLYARNGAPRRFI